jgi:hypothetical protein
MVPEGPHYVTHAETDKEGKWESAGKIEYIPGKKKKGLMSQIKEKGNGEPHLAPNQVVEEEF